MIRPIPHAAPTREANTAVGHRELHTPTWKRCVDKVKRRGRGNAFAICTASLKDRSFLR